MEKYIEEKIDIIGIAWSTIEETIDKTVNEGNPEQAFQLLKQYKDILKYGVMYEYRKKLCATIIKNGSIELAVQMATKFENAVGLKELEKKLLRTEKAAQIFLYLTGTNSRDKTKLEQRLQELKSAEFSCKYVNHLLSNFDKRIALEKQLIEEKMPSQNPNFEKELSFRIGRVKSEIKENKRIVYESKNPKYVYEMVSFLIGKSYITKLKTAKKYIQYVIECGNAEYINKILKLASEKMPDINISEYKPVIIQSGDSRQIYEMARMLKKQKNNDLEDAILKSNDVEMIFIYARNIQNIDIDFFTKKIIESDNYGLMTKYAREVLNKRQADINDVQEAIIRSKNTAVITNFAESVKGVNKDKCFEPILKTKSISIVLDYAKRVKEFSVEKVSEKIKNENDGYLSYGFITNHIDIDFEDHRRIILNSGNVELNLKFVNFLSGQSEEYKGNIDEHADVVIRSNNAQYKKMLSKILEPETPQVQQTTTKTKNKKYRKPRKLQDVQGKKAPVNDETRPEDLNEIWNQGIEWILKFAVKFPDQIEIISKRILETENPRWSYKFLNIFINVDHNEHRDVIFRNEKMQQNYKRYIEPRIKTYEEAQASTRIYTLTK